MGPKPKAPSEKLRCFNFPPGTARRGKPHENTFETNEGRLDEGRLDDDMGVKRPGKFEGRGEGRKKKSMREPISPRIES